MSVGEARRIAGRHQPARGAMRRDAGAPEHRLRRGADVGGDDRRRHDLRFRGGAPEGFRLDRGDDGDVRGAEGGGHVVLVADDAHALIEPGRMDLRCQRRPVGAAPLRVAGEDEHRVVEAGRCASSARRLDDDLLALPGGQPRGVQHDALACRRCPSGARTAATRSGATLTGSNSRPSTPR